MELFTASYIIFLIEVKSTLALMNNVVIISSPEIVAYEISGLVATVTKILCGVFS